jgi:hypothetical protein
MGTFTTRTTCARILMCAGIAMAFVTIGGAAQSAMSTLDRPLISKAAEPVACVGDRRSYRNFNHCWEVVSRSARPDVASKYCSKICH